MRKQCGYTPPPLIGSKPQKVTTEIDIEITRRELKKAFLDAIRYRGVGKWELSQDFLGIKVYKCSICDEDVVVESRFCPNCGAYMESEENE